MSNPTEPVPPSGTAPTGTPGGTARYSVPEVARVLGISERAVRKRITTGTLNAHKEGNAWVVLLPSTTEAVPAAPAAPGAVPERGTEGGTVDVAPLAEFLADVTRRNEELAAAAALWQYRAMQAEERLAQIESGPIAGDPSQDIPQERDTATLRGDQPALAADTLIDRIRRLFAR
ncbi:MAG: helix-turn-helix domain-containing protein [Chloroflexia bacterium]|nr:helix-turn-helix domain-containing protein [Chloroflexia bacterium]